MAEVVAAEAVVLWRNLNRRMENPETKTPSCCPNPLKFFSFIIMKSPNTGLFRVIKLEFYNKKILSVIKVAGDKYY